MGCNFLAASTSSSACKASTASPAEHHPPRPRGTQGSAHSTHNVQTARVPLSQHQFLRLLKTLVGLAVGLADCPAWQPAPSPRRGSTRPREAEALKGAEKSKPVLARVLVNVCTACKDRLFFLMLQACVSHRQELGKLRANSPCGVFRQACKGWG